MKKVILSVMIAGSLLATGCKKAKEVKDAAVETTTKAADATKDAANTVVDGAKGMVDKAGEAVESALEGVSIPKFENAEVTKHLESYATYAKDYIAAKGDVLKNAKLAKQGVALATKGKELLGSLDAESAKKFKSVMNMIQSKMAPAN